MRRHWFGLCKNLQVQRELIQLALAHSCRHFIYKLSEPPPRRAVVVSSAMYY
jgi:hypothetical protein